jgi:hypothetical protein
MGLLTKPSMLAMAFKLVVLEMVRGALYTLDAAVGIDPSSV